jgi:dTDP-4-dehydrorhamnose reductase
MDLPELDISGRGVCHAVLDAVRPEIVVNCAAYTAVDACEGDPACWKVNAEGPGYLAEWCAANGAFLVHVSTDYVFDGSRPLFEPYVETDSTGPVSEYGRSKLAGEQAVLESEADAAILRTAWLYGQQGKNFLKTMLRLTQQNPEKEFKVVADQFGSPTWSLTLARQIAAVAEARMTGIFHATSEGYGSWYELACAWLEVLGVAHRFVPCTSEEYPTPARRPVNSILENARLKAAGINLFGDWRDELKTFAAQCGKEILAG